MEGGQRDPAGFWLQSANNKLAMPAENQSGSALPQFPKRNEPVATERGGSSVRRDGSSFRISCSGVSVCRRKLILVRSTSDSHFTCVVGWCMPSHRFEGRGGQHRPDAPGQ